MAKGLTEEELTESFDLLGGVRRVIKLIKERNPGMN
jgi:hypothetical protein